MTTRRSVLALGCLGVLLTGCTGGGSAARATGPVAATASDPPSGSAPAPSGAAPAPSDDAPPVLLLQGDGLGLLAPDSSVAPLPFATAPAPAVQEAVEDALGETTSTALACPQGPRTGLQVDGFTVLLDGDHFVGWSDAGAADRALTTSDGIGTGSRLDELQSALPDVVVGPGPAGATAWSSAAAGLSGLLGGSDPAAVVTTVSAGQTCAAP